MYDDLSSVKACNVVTIWLFQYAHLAFQVQWTLDHPEATRDPLEPYYHPSKKTTKLQPHVQ